MAKAIEHRLTELERSTRGRQQTAADLIAMLQRQPRNADEFIAWERNLSPVERAALEAAHEHNR